MLNERPKAVLISVGGSPEPVVFSLNHQKPEHVCFFVSPETEASLRDKILPGLEFHPLHDLIRTPAAEDLSGCCRVLVRELPGILKKWGVQPGELVVDYTGGTKTMSAALMLAAAELAGRFSYVGGTDRTKDGVGVVVDGKEKMWFSDNPWDELAVITRREAEVLFNRGRYDAAAQAFRKIAQRVSDSRRPFYEDMARLAEAYEKWDRFAHSEAYGKLHSVAKALPRYAAFASDKAIESLAASVESHLDFLKTLREERDGENTILDLLANARRRALREGKYDDAVARLYRAVEAYAQWRLKSQYGVDTSAVEIQRIPEPFREEIADGLSTEDGKLKLGLERSYRLLRAFGDAASRRFWSMWESSLRGLLDRRNNSILAHGFVPITREDYEKFWEACLKFMEISTDRLPVFPELEL